MNLKIIKIIKELEKAKNKKHWHHICWAGSVIQRVDEWDEKEIYNCPHRGKNDWGIVGTHRKESPCKNCDGKLKGYLDLNQIERAENWGIDKAIQILKGNNG